MIVSARCPSNSPSGRSARASASSSSRASEPTSRKWRASVDSMVSSSAGTGTRVRFVSACSISRRAVVANAAPATSTITIAVAVSRRSTRQLLPPWMAGPHASGSPATTSRSVHACAPSAPGRAPGFTQRPFHRVSPAGPLVRFQTLAVRPTAPGSCRRGSRRSGRRHTQLPGHHPRS